MTGGSSATVRRLLLLVCLGVAGLAATSAFGASRSTQVQLGLLGNPARFDAATGQHSTVRLEIIAWGQDRGWSTYFPSLFAQMGDEPMLGIGIPSGSGLSPLAIAHGQGDAFLIRLNHAVANFGKPIYVRPLAEMNGHWNPYCAYNANGTSRGARYSTSAFRKAFIRMYLIVHGDPNADARLAHLGLPAVRGSLMPAPNVQIVWNPQGFGSPNLPGNSAAAYFPGNGYVDVVGDDLYDIRGKAEWPAADALYRRYPGKPFAFPEWGLWGIDDPSFISRMRQFVLAHRRTAVISFFNGKPGSIFDIASKPRSRAAYRRLIAPLAP